eukprot:scaffold23446_cov27-Phaeocystis_antarctica.AAC.1
MAAEVEVGLGTLAYCGRCTPPLPGCVPSSTALCRWMRASFCPSSSSDVLLRTWLGLGVGSGLGLGLGLGLG